MSRVSEILEAQYETVAEVEAAMDELRDMKLHPLNLEFCLSTLGMQRQIMKRPRRMRKELPVEPKGYRRAFKGARRDQRRTAIGREQSQDEKMFLRVVKRGMQEMQNRMLRRLRKIT